MNDSFSAWSHRLRASDATACTELFRALHAPLIYYAQQLLGHEQAACDVVQDAFIKLWEHRKTLDPERSLKAYLYTIVRNTAFHHMNTVRREQRYRSDEALPETAAASTLDETLVAEELQTKIRGWINELPPRRQEAFRLSRVNGLSHEEIATVMGLAPRTVTHHIMLALQHLRARLATHQAA